MRKIDLILLSMMLASSITQAQTLGEIRGKVFDPEGTPVFLANVSIDVGGELIGATTEF